MAIFEFSDNFDAQGWYTEQMLKGHSFDEDDFDIVEEEFIHDEESDDSFDYDIAWSEAFHAQWG